MASIWTLAVLLTLVAFAAAWRALARTDAALLELRSATEAIDGVTTATGELRRATAEAQDRRATLTARAIDPQG